MPAGPLMIEHRLIEKMIALAAKNLKSWGAFAGKVDPAFIDTMVDFIRTYADRCHHGKEEDILFRDLKKKPLSREHNKILNDLINEHIQARKAVSSLVTAKEDYVQGKKEAIKPILDSIKWLVEFYPVHILKEDRQYFIPVMKYFSSQEQSNMLKEFREFDSRLIHEKYKKVLENIKV